MDVASRFKTSWTKKRRRGRLHIALLFVALGAASCAPAIETIPPDYTFGPREEAIIVGRLEYIKSDGSTFPGGSWETMVLVVKNDVTGKPHRVQCDTSGFIANFYVALPVGTYTVEAWQIGGAGGKPPGAFRAEKGQVVYVGTVRYTIEESWGKRFLAALGGVIPGQYSVHDESEKALKDFRERFPHIKQEFVKSLLWSRQ